MGTRGYPRDEERCIRMTFVTHDAYVDPIFRKIQDGLETLKNGEDVEISLFEGSHCLPIEKRTGLPNLLLNEFSTHKSKILFVTLPFVDLPLYKPSALSQKVCKENLRSESLMSMSSNLNEVGSSAMGNGGSLSQQFSSRKS